MAGEIWNRWKHERERGVQEVQDTLVIHRTVQADSI